MARLTRILHPSYAPIQKARAKKGFKGCNNELTSGKRKSTVNIKRRNSYVGADQVQVGLPYDENYDKVEELKEFWSQTFFQAIGLAYSIETETKQLRLCEKIFEDIGDVNRIKALMRALLTHEDMAWVSNKTLSWLANRSNQTRVATVLKKKPKKTTRAEYSGDRTSETRIVFRSI